jgi:predicted  nucleic acid-binding Zn-ribbon protein
MVMLMEVKFCPDCGVERYNNSNYCLTCGFNFKYMTSHTTAEEDNNCDKLTGKQFHTSEEGDQNDTTDENLISTELREVSFTHVPYVQLKHQIIRVLLLK